jgi:hypothetical protein
MVADTPGISVRSNPDLDSVFLSAHSELRPRTPAPIISAEFYPFAGLNHTARYRDNRLLIRVSDVLQDAPGWVLHSLAIILLSRVYRRKADPLHLGRYRLFTLSSHIQLRAREARRTRGRQPMRGVTQGCHHNLDASFDRMNAEYFSACLERPALSWSRRKSRYTLGRYDSSHHAIYISRVLDQSHVPEFVVDYVMYHEMLHARHHTRLQRDRLIAHTREFREEESLFRDLDRARLWLRAHI